MSAWDELIEHSTAAPGSDAWEHLIAQEGGTGGYLILADGLEVYVMTSYVSCEIGTAAVSVDVAEPEIAVEIEQPEIEVTICNGN